MNMQVGNSYANVKDAWERRIMYVVDIHSCVFLKEDALYQYSRPTKRLSINELKKMGDSYTYDDIDAAGGLTQTRFLPRWLLDETKRSVQSVVFEPHMHHAPFYYNIFDGFAASKLPLLAADDSPILDFVRDVFAAGNAARADFILKWMAHIVKKPMEMTRVGLCLCGGDWVCRLIFLKFFAEEIIGSKYAVFTGSPKHSMLSRSAWAHHHRVLVVANNAYDARLDKLFTDPMYTYRTPTTIDNSNYLNVAVTLNISTAAMKSNPNLAVFDIDGMVDPVAQHELRIWCYSTAIAAAFYNRLMNMDLDGFVPLHAAAALRSAE